MTAVVVVRNELGRNGYRRLLVKANRRMDLDELVEKYVPAAAWEFCQLVRWEERDLKTWSHQLCWPGREMVKLPPPNLPASVEEKEPPPASPLAPQGGAKFAAGGGKTRNAVLWWIGHGMGSEKPASLREAMLLAGELFLGSVGEEIQCLHAYVHKLPKGAVADPQIEGLGVPVVLHEESWAPPLFVVMEGDV